TALNPYRVVFAVMDQADRSVGGAARPSLLFVLAALVVAATLIVVGVVRLRVWNPGRNEPREQREGEQAEELIESLVEVEEVPASAMVGAGAVSASGTGFGPPPAGPLPHQAVAEADDTAGATTGLHVPRRTHRRIVRAMR